MAEPGKQLARHSETTRTGLPGAQATVAEDGEQFRRVVEALVAQFQGAAGSRLLARRGASVVRTPELSARQLVCE